MNVLNVKGLISISSHIISIYYFEILRKDTNIFGPIIIHFMYVQEGRVSSPLLKI